MRLLIVEDDAALARGIGRALRDQGFAVDHTAYGNEAIEIVKLEPYSGIILDLGLPDMDGLDVVRIMRSTNITTPILILTGRDATSDRVTGLDQGADDYLTKPFALAELEARTRALIRRGQGKPDPILSYGSLQLNRTTGAIYLTNILLELTRRERQVAETLLVHGGRVVPKARLSADVFGYDDPVAPNALEVYIARLRRKIAGSDIEIVTIRGLGYILQQG